MGFNEKLHAYIAARFYVRLTHTFGEKGKAAFIYATQYYAEQRGRRMAMRAIQDGQPLTYETYRAYGEWESTKDMQEEGCANRSETVSTDPVYEFHVTVCPWHEEFKTLGLEEAGLVYCAHLDNSIARGFNPYLVYEVPQTLHDCPFCVQKVSNLQGLAPGQTAQGAFDPAKARPEADRRRGFTYHCAHSYWSYARCAARIFGRAGRQLADEVLEDISGEWGASYSNFLLKYKADDFEMI
ncbi:MAG: L-2-amino-thiazoline-4-carboxylic acid hydrolase [Firmicutes bacterium]|nr:L-2-amino-thiazoline-4-carboxylic acid hydrolase [Bacillota bacterium]MBR3749422.1 L-2-amino-thiazoline-4-carboxylic acid hydrolase [Bacillota bacterium]MBR6971041.1 L-2-amino-thiazoline-4-carboxylic acid hydrolase [Bacillota bacterium]